MHPTITLCTDDEGELLVDGLDASATEPKTQQRVSSTPTQTSPLDPTVLCLGWEGGCRPVGGGSIEWLFFS